MPLSPVAPELMVYGIVGKIRTASDRANHP